VRALIVDLSMAPLEVIVRGGQPTETNLMRGYREFIRRHGVYGFSIVLHPGYTVDQLARAARFRHGRIAYATVQELQGALAVAGYNLILIKTPTAALPDHHTLSVEQGGVPLPALPLAAAQALSTAFHEMSNTYPSP
jgi:hypothetical protein